MSNYSSSDILGYLTNKRIYVSLPQVRNKVKVFIKFVSVVAPSDGGFILKVEVFALRKGIQTIKYDNEKVHMFKLQFDLFDSVVFDIRGKYNFNEEYGSFTGGIGFIF